MDNHWIDREEYPFESHFMEFSCGKLHYIDEGRGEPVLFLHGNPTWSFMYRHLIKGLSNEYRCIAPDLFGFGLSSKPIDWTYLPEDHSQIIDQFITRLGLKGITLVAHDFGGPIGISCVIKRPDDFKRLVLSNTWLTPPSSEMRVRMFSSFMGSAMGKILTERFLIFPRLIMPLVSGDILQMVRTVNKHYLMTHKASFERKGMWVFPRSLTSSEYWYSSLWEKRNCLSGIPSLLLWGMKDPAFGKKQLTQWEELFPTATTVRYDKTGHYLPEELGALLIDPVTQFMLAGE